MNNGVARSIDLKEIPTEIRAVTETLERAGFEAYLVGGCVRDLLIGKEPKDWDVTTNATPEEIMGNFPNTFYTNSFGTVGVVNEDTQDERLKIVEVTPYRLESSYSDARRPDVVTFSKHLEDDLQRRDFTVNAIAFSPSQGQIIDLYGGFADIENKILKTVGDPQDRFTEDGLRILRAIRLSAELGFTISHETREAIRHNAVVLEKISAERIRDEFVRIVEASDALNTFNAAHELGVLQYFLPELELGIGVEQKGAHVYSVWEHNVRALEHAQRRNFSLHVKIAALLHDVAKPHTQEWSEEKGKFTFYGHDVVGAKLSRAILKRLKFSQETVSVVSNLVRNHLFFSDVDKISMSAVRRIIRQVGTEHIWELMDLRACDRIGMGRPKENPYRLRKYESMIEEALRDPLTVGMLKIDGLRVMEVTREKPGPKIGLILHALLEEVLNDPNRNTADYLEKRSIELCQLPTEKLRERALAGKEKRDELEQEEVRQIRRKHSVK